METHLALHWPCNPKSAVADGIVTYNVFSEDKLDVAMMRPFTAWSADQKSQYMVDVFQPIIMVYKATLDNERTGLHQLALYIATAIHHRIALGLDKEGDENAVYGLLQVGSRLILYVGTPHPRVRASGEHTSFQPWKIVRPILLTPR